MLKTLPAPPRLTRNGFLNARDKRPKMALCAIADRQRPCAAAADAKERLNKGSLGIAARSEPALVTRLGASLHLGSRIELELSGVIVRLLLPRRVRARI